MDSTNRSRECTCVLAFRFDLIFLAVSGGVGDDDDDDDDGFLPSTSILGYQN